MLVFASTFFLNLLIITYNGKTIINYVFRTWHNTINPYTFRRLLPINSCPIQHSNISSTNKHSSNCPVYKHTIQTAQFTDPPIYSNTNNNPIKCFLAQSATTAFTPHTNNYKPRLSNRHPTYQSTARPMDPITQQPHPNSPNNNNNNSNSLRLLLKCQSTPPPAGVLHHHHP